MLPLQKTDMKRVIVISTSLRHGSNSDLLADKFAEGALSAGNDRWKCDTRPGLSEASGLNCNWVALVKCLLCNLKE